MSSKKKILKGIESIEKMIKEHEKKLAEAPSEEGRHYLFKDLERLKKPNQEQER